MLCYLRGPLTVLLVGILVATGINVAAKLAAHAWIQPELHRFMGVQP